MDEERTPAGLPWQDLSRDALIANAPRVAWQGKQVPALGGIPLVAKLGQGAMGAVYYGVHPRLEVEVAVKVLPFHLAAQHPELIQRFFREAKNAAKIKSPHLVTVLDVDEEQSIHFLVMEYVAGKSARECLAEVKETGRPGLEEGEALSICAAAAAGLAAAHGKGIIHRDIKPDNILVPFCEPPVARAGEAQRAGLNFAAAKLTDLGIARNEEHGHSLTLAHVSLGTPGYMAPEQAEDAKEAAKPADVFAMGATLYALLAGAAPFQGSTLLKVLRRTAEQPHTPIWEVRPEVSLATAQLLDRCLAKKPGERYADGTALREALASCQAKLLASGAPAAPPPQSPGQPAPAFSFAPTVFAAAKSVPKLPGQKLALDLSRGVKLELVLVPAGAFLMGSPETEKDRGLDEIQHQVALSKPFYMGKYAVTQEQYEAVMGHNPSFFKGPKHPVERVPWNDAQQFCIKASAVTGKTILLPSEAQWEYACRAGTATRFNTGGQDSALEQAAWFDRNADRRTHPVGQQEPNAWGLFDMHGNVWEWMQDFYSEKYYAESPPVDPRGPAEGRARVLRGGSWDCAPDRCRSARRGSGFPGIRANNRGFRCMVDL
ncbi:MAG: bifunctional serine/threonine-protein kinase/formylglycine-generating enzyme family protein [Planctomycetota bacterium]